MGSVKAAGFVDNWICGYQICKYRGPPVVDLGFLASCWLGTMRGGLPRGSGWFCAVAHIPTDAVITCSGHSNICLCVVHSTESSWSSEETSSHSLQTSCHLVCCWQEFVVQKIKERDLEMDKLFCCIKSTYICSCWFKQLFKIIGCLVRLFVAWLKVWYEHLTEMLFCCYILILTALRHLLLSSPAVQKHPSTGLWTPWKRLSFSFGSGTRST